MNNAIIPGAIRLKERPIVDMTHDDVEVAHCVPRCGTLRTDDLGFSFDHINGNTYWWSAAYWQQVTREEASSWGQLVPDNPPWIVLVRHAYAARMRRRLPVHNVHSLTSRPLLP